MTIQLPTVVLEQFTNAMNTLEALGKHESVRKFNDAINLLSQLKS
jgi:hypothetical protein